MKCDVSISLLYLVFALIRPGCCEGIEKVSYLLQYGPGVHTVFEQENTPDKVTVNVKDRVASSTTVQPSTLTSTSSVSQQVSERTVSGLSVSTLAVTHSPSNTPTEKLHPSTPVTDTVPSTPVTPGSNPTEKKGDTSSTTFSNNSMLPQPSTLSITSQEKKRPTGSMAEGPDERQRIQATSAAPCHTPVSVLQKLHPLPLPPALPTFGAILRSDVMVNLKPKELRTLMSTYIGLVEAYKSFNQQQKRNIAHLEEELARHELIKARADRLRNTKVEILNK
ncbi:uncharacterized protein LOC118511510 [Anopheles stephensi]|uniref:uncharacterized protein LOC118511510 n=1 Tax=Anopheles stephensi TaxID=30069 RepID=UPI0007D307D5|nr:uncharacterized protein LOC118511510 [Anopheles stephensi]XP_035910578.1 uncharacterized protein LOC118511510 [Anopheles stephensi]